MTVQGPATRRNVTQGGLPPAPLQSAQPTRERTARCALCDEAGTEWVSTWGGGGISGYQTPKTSTPPNRQNGFALEPKLRNISRRRPTWHYQTSRTDEQADCQQPRSNTWPTLPERMHKEQEVPQLRSKLNNNF